MQRNWIGRSEGAEVTFSAPELGVDYSVFTTRPDTLFGATFFVMAPEHPDVLRLAAGTEHEQAVREYVNGVLSENREDRADTERTKTGVPLGRSVINPVNGERDPDVRRRLRADGVRHGRDHGRPGPRRARLRLRDRVRPADPPRRRRRRRAALQRRRPAGELLARVRRHEQPRGAGADRRLARPRGQGPPLDQLPPARLAAVPPALLGRADPDRLLRRARHRPGARGGPAGRAAGRRGLRAAGPLAAGRGRGLGQHDLPDLRRPRAPRDGHDGHVRRLVLVLPALHATPTTTRPRGTRRSSPCGRRPTSTSAASSTRSCT